jgi:putative CRISPR-associated protein (TIGR02619 family)
MPDLIISTCGTSLLTNKCNPDLRASLTKMTNKKQIELSPEEIQIVDERVQICLENLNQADPENARKLSAELNGIIGYYGNDISKKQQDMHYLVHTDTYQGEKVAQVLQNWLRDNFGIANTQLQKIDELNTRTLSEFNEGIKNCITFCHEQYKGFHASHRIIFNLVGGFKSLQGMMQALGMLWADEILYIFESSDELLRIPKLPVSIDDSFIAKNEVHFRRFYLPKYGTESPSMKFSLLKDAPQSLFCIVGDDCEPLPLAYACWLEYESKLYKKGLLEPLGKEIQITHKFKRSVNGLQPDRMEKINKMIDDLYVYMISSKVYKSLSLRVHPLIGNPMLGATHECYAWSDQNASRSFFHFDDNNRLVLDLFGEHL